MKAPVLLIAFNRPDFTSIVFETIRHYKPSKFYIAVDGPREKRTQEVADCERVRKVAERIDWACEVKTLYRNENLGCKLAVSSAIDWFFENEEMGIILEDDVVPDPSFFYFCEELLEYYKNDSRIGMISGDNFGFGHRRNQNSYYYSLYTHIWGWASWRRAWQGYDANMKDYTEFFKNGWLNDLFPDPIEFQFWKRNFDAVAYESFDTWDFQWVYHNLKNGRLNIMPAVNLIKNIGFGEGAAHTTHPSPLANMKTDSLFFPLVHPNFIVRDLESDAFSKKTFINPDKKIRGRIFNLLNPLRLLIRLRSYLLGAN
ncbi:glycosyl transferase [Leptospira stimsonii]|uniref:Glycosyl transferase n=1 Tax=Leptospira stimsonii TaxID=2202203 RepID=A0ABY2MVV2_9LEPT|nr:glycosyl transferase [Leptospira stimsonii]TGK14540.1 glycosyl transferase [Leptospira stimsonii]TGM09963.1 glycosyl transferase [Leptospira stimsonii]